MAVPPLRVIHSALQVRQRIESLAEEIAGDGPEGGERPRVLLAIAEGARRFGSALCDALTKRGERVELQLVRARRSERGMRLGEVRIERFDTLDLRGRDVLVVDDIADEGRTLQAVLGAARSQEPRSLRVAVLVSKRARRRVTLRLDHVGFEVDAGWVVGMGMDLDDRYRDLDCLAVVEETTR
ncbi:MAG: phosphoribosyltransferase [Myxococcota bacterium]